MAIAHTKRKQTCIYKLPSFFQNFNVEYFILSILAVFYLLNTSIGSPHLDKEIISWRQKNIVCWGRVVRHHQTPEQCLLNIPYSNRLLLLRLLNLKIIINNLYLNFNYFTIFYIQYKILSTSNWASDVKPLFSSSSQPIWLQTGYLNKSIFYLVCIASILLLWRVIGRLTESNQRKGHLWFAFVPVLCCRLCLCLCLCPCSPLVCVGALVSVLSRRIQRKRFLRRLITSLPTFLGSRLGLRKIFQHQALFLYFWKHCCQPHNEDRTIWWMKFAGISFPFHFAIRWTTTWKI